MSQIIVPMILRGEVIEDNLIEIPARGGSISFKTPNARAYLDQIPMGHPARMQDLYTINFEEILDYLVELGQALDVNKNEYMQQARELTYAASPMTPSLIDGFYQNAPTVFDRRFLREMADMDLGINYLEGWVEETVHTGPKIKTRCFGSRAVHIAAGNGPSGTIIAVIRNAITRSDGILKSPSNDPFTGPAIVRTMCEMAPDHPLTKHFSIAYWRGGDEDFESRLYQPHNVEKIVAWGGYSALKHVAQYVQPGLELISLDPKRSASVVGPEAFESEEEMQEAANRLASDFGGFNQVGCTNSRVAYILCGSDDEGLEKAKRFSKLAYDALFNMPENYSTKPKSYSAELKSKIDALSLQDDFYHVIGTREGEGGVVLSLFPDQVDFMPEMDGRTINIVPVDTIEDVTAAVDSYTQTVGIYPESLKNELMDILPLFGTQRIVSLGYASNVTIAGAQDAIEPMRRMTKWVVNEICSPETRTPLWLRPEVEAAE